jgi:hypothetical protein
MSVLSFLRNSCEVDLWAALADDVHFHSSAANYVGRENVVELLTAISSLLEISAVARTVRDDATTTTFFTARVDGQGLDGVLGERLDSDGRIAEVRLFSCPHAASDVAIRQLRSKLVRDRLEAVAEDWLARAR